jgi:hypothetical protein
MSEVVYDLFAIRRIYSAFADKVECNCHFPVPGRNCKKQAVDFIVFKKRYLTRVGKTL